MEAHVRLADPDGAADPLQRWFTERCDALGPLLGRFFETNWPEGYEKPARVELSVSFLDSAAIAQLNGRYRGEPHGTDVLSFPLWDFEPGGELPPCGDAPLPLGDVVFCLEKCRENARAAGGSEEQELVLLLCHSCLHLIGFDHADEEEERRMWALQEQGRDDLLRLLGEQR